MKLLKSVAPYVRAALLIAIASGMWALNYSINNIRKEITNKKSNLIVKSVKIRAIFEFAQIHKHTETRTHGTIHTNTHRKVAHGRRPTRTGTHIGTQTHRHTYIHAHMHTLDIRIEACGHSHMHTRQKKKVWGHAREGWILYNRRIP